MPPSPSSLSSFSQRSTPRVRPLPSFPYLFSRPPPILSPTYALQRPRRGKRFLTFPSPSLPPSRSSILLAHPFNASAMPNVVVRTSFFFSPSLDFSILPFLSSPSFSPMVKRYRRWRVRDHRCSISSSDKVTSVDKLRTGKECNFYRNIQIHDFKENLYTRMEDLFHTHSKHNRN